MQRLEKINKVNLDPNGKLGNFGAVVGATLNLQSVGLGHLYSDELLSPILAPGFGAQGAELSNCGELFGAAANRVIASVSRSVLSAGQNGLVSAIETANRELMSGLNRD
jgi:orotidine-5'-phosphate decarboxylase